VLDGTLAITTRDPDDTHIITSGGRWQITPGKQHLVQNGGSEDCRFLLVQEQENSILLSRRRAMLP